MGRRRTASKIEQVATEANEITGRNKHKEKVIAVIETLEQDEEEEGDGWGEAEEGAEEVEEEVE